MVTAQQRQLAQVFAEYPSPTGTPHLHITFDVPAVAYYVGGDSGQLFRLFKFDELRALALEVAPGAVELLDSLGTSWEGGIEDLVTAARCCGAQVPTDRELQGRLTGRYPLPRGKAPRQRRLDLHSRRPAGTDRAATARHVRGRHFR